MLYYSSRDGSASTYESPHPYEIKNKENQLFRTIHSVWWVHWLCLGVQRVVGALTQLLRWVQEASGVYVPSTHLLFSRSQHTTHAWDSTLQNIQSTSCLAPVPNHLSVSGVLSPLCVRVRVWRRVLPHYVWDALWYGFFFLFARYTGGSRNTNTFLSNKKQKKSSTTSR